MAVFKTQSALVKFFEGGQTQERQPKMEETADTLTGLAPDIHRPVELRRAKRATALDNLITEPSPQ